ncbi:hypothetical protein [Pleurocapsa sp. PCC 7319]|uniref:hypothetical protein n=1 Tax=Pleurocapsa sp. PCC 7319 TaxID=118161 RepID=UPI0003666D70|nr:hypothetical protein [Pleurocapsa sp. PCC 7319]
MVSKLSVLKTQRHRELQKTAQLRSVLVIPFVSQIFAVVGVTGYLSLRNGQKSVDDLVSHLRQKVNL